jgi:hypothetical protein
MKQKQTIVLRDTNKINGVAELTICGPFFIGPMLTLFLHVDS